MRDERDFQTRQAAHRDHAAWEQQHEAWLTEAAGWVRRLDDHRETLERLGHCLDDEQAGIDRHVERIRGHEGSIASHDLALAKREGGGCGDCEGSDLSTHDAAAALHRAEDATHARFAERQRQLAKRLALIAELFPAAD
jgi:hypothetical protein